MGLAMKRKNKRVLLALSGGVDSSVAAVLLIKQGFEVRAAFMKNWSNCAFREERREAWRVAARLGLPLITFDFEKEYRARVATYLFEEYARGRTPNPDVLCNDQVKFPLLWREAKKLGCDFIATGHHVRKRQENNQWQLLVGRDSAKDQSYFLHRLNQTDLDHTLFPIGDYTKLGVRALARKQKLPTAERRSSRGLCFIGPVKMSEFLASRIEMESGPILTRQGQKIGQHQGLAPLTIGQRHGFGGWGGQPYFVVGKKLRTNALIVVEENDPALWSSKFKVQNLHWIAGEKPAWPLVSEARVRYRMPRVKARLERNMVRLVRPVRAISPGQFAVFYDGEVCLGGGVIL